jgi:adenosylcobinamide-GDP ribazoletransferase
LIRQLAAGISFLTRLPVFAAAFDAREVGKSMRWFPLVGALIGGIYAAGLLLFSRIFPPFVAAALIVAMEAPLTGALHLDGLADTADGFGGSRKREDALRIMRDHSIGAYGAVALILLIALKLTAIAALIENHAALAPLVIAPVLGRWSLVALSAALPYARAAESERKASNFAGRTELIIATVIALVIAAAVAQWRGLVACAIVAAVTALWGWYCKRRIGGITGDTLGASAEIAEAFVLLAAAVRP